MAQRIRPTWTELLSMDADMAEIVIEGLPRLDDAVMLGAPRKR